MLLTVKLLTSSSIERPLRVLSALTRELEAAHERRRQRRALLAMDDRLLKDIGLSRADAEREASKGWRR